MNDAAGMKVVLVASIWAQIVFRINESDDAYLRQLVEQASAGAASPDLRCSCFEAGRDPSCPSHGSFAGWRP